MEKGIKGSSVFFHDARENPVLPPLDSMAMDSLSQFLALTGYAPMDRITDDPDAETVFVVPGYMMSPWILKLIWDVLYSNGKNVVYARFSWTDPRGLDGITDDLAEQMAKARDLGGKFSFIGHSLGCIVVMHSYKKMISEILSQEWKTKNAHVGMGHLIAPPGQGIWDIKGVMESQVIKDVRGMGINPYGNSPSERISKILVHTPENDEIVSPYQQSSDLIDWEGVSKEDHFYMGAGHVDILQGIHAMEVGKVIVDNGGPRQSKRAKPILDHAH